MVLAIARPIRLPNSPHPYARKVVPKDLRGILGRSEFKRPLRAETQAEVKRLHAEALAEWEGLIADARRRLTSPAQTMTARDIAAVGGAYYRAEVARYEADPGSAGAWDITRDLLIDRLPEGPEEEVDERHYPPTPADLAEAAKLWDARGIVADADTLRRTAQDVWLAKVRAYETLTKRAEGDWTTDDYAARYPQASQDTPGTAQTPPTPTAGAPLSFASLVDQCALERLPPRKTREKWDAAFRSLAASFGHDDARRVVVADVAKWKQARTALGRATKTVADGISTARSVMNWGIRNGLLPKDNPFSGMAPRVSSAGEPPRVGYNDTQAAALLRAARAERGWKRWLPWVLAFTGARIEEVAELRRCDVRREAGV